MNTVNEITVQIAIDFVKKGGVEYQKVKFADRGLKEAQHKLVREIGRVERDMYRLHWVGRFLSIIGL